MVLSTFRFPCITLRISMPTSRHIAITKLNNILLLLLLVWMCFSLLLFFALAGFSYQCDQFLRFVANIDKFAQPLAVFDMAQYDFHHSTDVWSGNRCRSKVANISITNACRESKTEITINFFFHIVWGRTITIYTNSIGCLQRPKKLYAKSMALTENRLIKLICSTKTTTTTMTTTRWRRYIENKYLYLMSFRIL